MGRILNVVRQNTISELHKAVEEWELRVVEHEARFTDTVSDSIRVAALKKMMPLEMVDRFIDGPHEYQELRARMGTYMVEKMSLASESKGPVRVPLGTTQM